MAKTTASWPLNNCAKSAFPLATLAATAAWQQRSTDTYASATFVSPEKTLFAQVHSESVDYAVLEHGPGNAHVGDVLATDSHHNLVYASHRLVSLVGVSHLVVI